MSSGITTGQREENRFRIRSLSNSIFQRSDRILLVAVRTGEEIELRIASFMLKTNETRIDSTKNRGKRLQYGTFSVEHLSKIRIHQPPRLRAIAERAADVAVVGSIYSSF
jgi:hypothetical protein